MLAPGCEFVATSLHSTDGGDHAAICELMPGEVCGDDAESLACVERMNQSSYLTVTPSTLNLKEGYYRLTNETAQVSVSAKPLHFKLLHYGYSYTFLLSIWIRRKHACGAPVLQFFLYHGEPSAI